MPITVETWPGRDEAVQLQARRVEDRLQRRADRHVVAERGEVLDALGPRAQQRDRGRRRRRLEADREEDHLAVGVATRELERVERRIDHAHVGTARLRLEQRAAAAGHAQHVAEGREDHLGPLGERDRVVDAAHRDHADRAARAVQEVDLGRHEILDPVLVDRVRVPAADLHELQRAAGLDQASSSCTSFCASSPERNSSTNFIAAPSASRVRSRRGRAGRRPTATGSTSSMPTRSCVAPQHDGRGRAVDVHDRRGDRGVAAGDAVTGVEPSQGGALLDLAQLLLVGLAHLLEQLDRLARLLLRRSARGRSRRGSAPSRPPRPRGTTRRRPPAARPRSRPWRGSPPGRRSRRSGPELPGTCLDPCGSGRRSQGKEARILCGKSAPAAPCAHRWWGVRALRGWRTTRGVPFRQA